MPQLIRHIYHQHLYSNPQRDRRQKKTNVSRYGGFQKWWIPKWMVYNGKSHLEVDDFHRGTPISDHFRNPHIRCWFGMSEILTINNINMYVLVGGLEHVYFSYIENNPPNWLSYFSEGLKPPTRYFCSILLNFTFVLSHPFWVPCDFIRGRASLRHQEWGGASEVDGLAAKRFHGEKWEISMVFSMMFHGDKYMVYSLNGVWWHWYFMVHWVMYIWWLYNQWDTGINGVFKGVFIR